MAKTKSNIVVKDETELLLKKGFKEAKAAAKEKSSVENLKNLTEAERLLDAHRAKKAAPGEKPFKDAGAVLEYLQAGGWKVQKTKLYDDRNKITCQRDGTWLKVDVDKYAALCLEKKDRSNNEVTGEAERKARLQNEILEEQRDKLRKANELESGRWELTSDTENEFAAFANYTKNAVGAEFIHRAADRIIETVKGDPGRAPELVELWLLEVEDLFDRCSSKADYATPDITEE